MTQPTLELNISPRLQVMLPHEVLLWRLVGRLGRALQRVVQELHHVREGIAEDAACGAFFFEICRTDGKTMGNPWKLRKPMETMEKLWKLRKPMETMETMEKLWNLWRTNGKLMELIREIGSTDGNTGWKLDGK